MIYWLSRVSSCVPMSHAKSWTGVWRRHGVGNLNALKPATPQEPHKACPIRLNKLLTDNGKEFTDRLFASRERQPSGRHEFAQF